jgi:hypothetical protein
VVERLRSQPPGYQSHLLECLPYSLACLLEWCPVPSPRQAVQLKHYRGELLADLVVQLARNPPTFALLRREGPSCAVAALRLQPGDHFVEPLGDRAQLWHQVTARRAGPGP